MGFGTTTLALSAAGAAALAAALPKLTSRLQLSRAKHRSLSGHARMARRIAALVPFYEYDEARFFRCDHAPEDVAAQVVVLASERLSGHVTGELVTVAGGMEGRVLHAD